ncbi:hypothetical protein [Streptosporangium jomthongense]|uniref:Uncharacterized protein n=1 Tax=Streptosporangium jomthongense TaxID=1193683 RepID=A0ABV8EWY0_9ACTN
MPEHYRTDELVRVIVEGRVTHFVADEAPGELTVALQTATGLYDVTVPTDVATIERLVPADGVPRLGEIWRDRYGCDWFARRDANTVALQAATGPAEPWVHVNQTCGPLTKVYPVSVIVLDGGQPVEPEQPAVEVAADVETPELRVGDRWRDRESCVWRVVETYGQLMLACDYTGEQQWWEGVSAGYGPLERVTDTTPGGEG